MQNLNGKFTQLSEQDVVHFWQQPKVVHIGMVFKIKWCYFQISKITSNGIEAKGLSRKEYHDLKRGRPDWC